MKQNSLHFLLALHLRLGSGCVNMAAYDSVPRPPATQIDIFRDGLTPTRPYKEIGTIERKGELGEQASIEKKFVAKAKAIGGNGFLLQRLPTSEGAYEFRAT